MTEKELIEGALIEDTDDYALTLSFPNRHVYKLIDRNHPQTHSGLLNWLNRSNSGYIAPYEASLIMGEPGGLTKVIGFRAESWDELINKILEEEKD